MKKYQGAIEKGLLQRDELVEQAVFDAGRESPWIALDQVQRLAEYALLPARLRASGMVESNTIGPYRILEPLGRGGMGVVYRARHTGSERAIALKTVGVTSPRWLDCIRREIHALTRIRHQGVVRIVDHGVQHGRPWYAMDLLEGESLRHFGQRIWSPFRHVTTPIGSTDRLSITEGLSGEFLNVEFRETEAGSHAQLRPADMPPVAAGELRAVLLFLRRICATLAFLHGEGFINCDLKPENVLLVGEQPVIIDFGLSAQHPGGSGREELDSQRAMFGTLPYMSPEQIRGEFVDARSDLYAVGCILYELVVGTPPFVGAPRVVVNQHLTATPVPPSKLVLGVPPELERLVLRLLEKNLPDRFGYADEVAAILADISDDIRRLPDYPPSRSYLYRPSFVGREELHARLSSLRDRARAGAGCLVMLGGESGVGKTRFAMELTRIIPTSCMQVVTSEASSLSNDSAAAVGPGPLHAVRTLLQVVADRCQEGGPDVTARLLGHRRSVLAPYEPLLACVPTTESQPPTMPLAVDAARKRLFGYLAETIANLAEELPILWVIDDVGWADELSLAFLGSLTTRYLESTPIFILCTYRSEERTEGLAALTQLPHVTHLTLPRLGPEAVRSMISDMLALKEPPEGFVEFVSSQAEGIPFFVAEYLRTAVNERVLFRDQDQSWRLSGPTRNELRDYEALPLPRSLLKLIGHRLRQLSPAAQQTITGAAVLGRESEISLLGEVTAMSEAATVDAVDELIRRQILEYALPGQVRFVHDKLREVAYSEATSEQLVQLHARAATCLESHWRGRAVESSIWATLGHHFAAAQLTKQAAQYLRLAANHARATFANSDAIRLYQEAINQAKQTLLRLENDSETGLDTLADLFESLGDVFSLTGRRDEARRAYEEALVAIPETGAVVRARVCRKIGKTWETQHHHEEALRYYVIARDALGSDPVRASAGHCEQFLQAYIDQLWVYYWLNNVPDMEATLRKLQPLIEAYGAAPQRAGFFQTQMLFSFRRDRYIVTEQTLKYARSSLEACKEAGGESDLPAAQLIYGLALLFQKSLDAAERELLAVLPVAERSGDHTLELRCLTYLSLCARMRGRVQEVQRYTQRCATVATLNESLEYIAAARANEAWLSLREGEFAAANVQARKAVELWKNRVFPFQWMALLPFMESELAIGNIELAVSAADALLEATQQCLPGAAADALARATDNWSRGEASATRGALLLALQSLENTGYR